MDITKLSKQETRVFNYIGQGLKNSDIAKEMGLSPRTIETNRDRIMMKLNLDSTTEIVKVWIWSQTQIYFSQGGISKKQLKKILGIN